MNSTARNDAAMQVNALSDNCEHERAGDRQLLVDVSVILRTDAQTGIQRVVRALLGALISAQLGGYIVCPVFATRKAGYAYVNSGAPEANPSLALSGQVTAGPGDIFLALDLAANILPLHRRQLLMWRRRGCQIVTVMYDLLPEQRPDWFNPKTRRNYRRWLRTVTKVSDQIICISSDVATQLEGWVAARPWRGNRRLKFNHMRLGSDIGQSTPSRGLPGNAASLVKHFARQRMLLVVGTIEPRKGHKCLLPAFEALWHEVDNEDLSLVFVGRPGWKTEQFQANMRIHPEAGKRFFWFDDASDEFLEHLYAVACGAIVPSLAEGFGLPLAEAIGYGIPVLARDLPVFRAMNLANVTYFSQDQPSLLAASIAKWLRQDSQFGVLEQQSVPTWADSFADLLKCLSIKDLNGHLTNK